MMSTGMIWKRTSSDHRKEEECFLSVSENIPKRMGKNVFLFSGQGSQYSGMGQELAAITPSSAAIYECAADILGFDLKELCFHGEEAKLAQTIVSQPAIFATSLVAWEAAKAKGLSCSAVAGHSLGEYAAMVASGMLSVEDGFRAIKARSEAMQECAEHSQGGMVAILGLDPQTIEDICAKTPGYVVPVNYNSPAQTVIAGEKSALEQAVSALSAAGAKRTVPLAVSAAFHSKMMQPAADRFAAEIQSISFNKPTVAFYSNVTGGLLTDFDDMPAYLAKHILSPVRFVSELQLMQKNGYQNFIELGPNKVLTGLVKKTLKDVTAVNIENEKTLNAVPVMNE